MTAEANSSCTNTAVVSTSRRSELADGTIFVVLEKFKFHVCMYTKYKYKVLYSCTSIGCNAKRTTRLNWLSNTCIYICWTGLLFRNSKSNTNRSLHSIWLCCVLVWFRSLIYSTLTAGSSQSRVRETHTAVHTNVQTWSVLAARSTSRIACWAPIVVWVCFRVYFISYVQQCNTCKSSVPLVTINQLRHPASPSYSAHNTQVCVRAKYVKY